MFASRRMSLTSAPIAWARHSPLVNLGPHHVLLLRRHGGAGLLQVVEFNLLQLIRAQDRQGDLRSFEDLKGGNGMLFMLSRSFDW